MLKKDLFEKIVEYIDEENDGAIEGNRPFIFTNEEKFMLAATEDGSGLELYNMETEKYQFLSKEEVVNNLFRIFDEAEKV